jgi:hypothetical protein
MAIAQRGGAGRGIEALQAIEDRGSRITCSIRRHGRARAPSRKSGGGARALFRAAGTRAQPDGAAVAAAAWLCEDMRPPVGEQEYAPAISAASRSTVTPSECPSRRIHAATGPSFDSGAVLDHGTGTHLALDPSGPMQPPYSITRGQSWA